VELLQYLLPDQKNLQLESWFFDTASTHLSMTVVSTQTVVSCPLCQGTTHRIHSRYERTLQDLPCVNYGITLHLQVRKFFCVNAACSRRIFTERLPEVTVPWARRTCRLAERLIAIGLALGGAAGARLSQRLGCAVSCNTLLYLISKLPLPLIATPQKLGVDDFAFRKRQSYGTILVDLEQSRPIALLKDRESQTLAQWLKQHPGIQVLSRDRSVTYKSGMKQGTPYAIQVADRFHLLQNLAKVLEQVLGRQEKAIKAVDTAHRLASATDTEGIEAVPVLPPSPLPQVQQLTEQRRVQRL